MRTFKIEVSHKTFEEILEGRMTGLYSKEVLFKHIDIDVKMAPGHFLGIWEVIPNPLSTTSLTKTEVARSGRYVKALITNVNSIGTPKGFVVVSFRLLEGI